MKTPSVVLLENKAGLMLGSRPVQSDEPHEMPATVAMINAVSP